MTGVELIAAERQRHVALKGWTPQHDDEHTRSELTRAAISYAVVAASRAISEGSENFGIPSWWPWDALWWKPSPNPIRNLVKAGALIAAEIDRLQRAAKGAEA